MGGSQRGPVGLSRFQCCVIFPLLQGTENFSGDVAVTALGWKQDNMNILPASWQSTWEEKRGVICKALEQKRP